MSTRKINELLSKTKHYDADERYMAINDLIKELQSLDRLEPNLQVPIRVAILTLLEDKGADVSTIAVRALRLMVEKFNPEQIIVIVDNMGSMLVDPGKKDTRESYCEGLKTVLQHCGPETGQKIAPKLIQNLQIGLSGKDTDDEAKNELACMGVLTGLLENFGSHVQDALAPILKSLILLLEHPYESARLEACQTLGPLTPYLPADEFEKLMQIVIKKIQNHSNPGVFIQSVVVISKFAALRVAKYLDVLIPILIDFVKTEGEDLETTIVLWSNCFEAFNSLIQRCPNSITQKLNNEIIELSQKRVSYDPNLAPDDSKMEDDENADEADDDFDFGDDDNEWGNDGGDVPGAGGTWGEEDEVPETSADASYKVRRSAVRVLSTFIRARSDLLKDYVEDLSEKLISRFSERDGAVQEQVFYAFKDLIHETCSNGIEGGGAGGRRGSTSVDEDLPGIMVPNLIRQRSFFQVVERKIPTAVIKLSEAFPKANIGTKKAMIGVLSEILKVKEKMGEHFPVFMPHVFYALTASDKAAVLNEDAINLTKVLLKQYDFDVLQPYVKNLADCAVKVVEQAQILIKPKGLILCGKVALCTKGHVRGNKELEAVVSNLYITTETQLEQKATNETIKVASIDAMASIISSHGDFLGKQCKVSLGIIQQRLSNEVTRVSALRAFTKIANSEAKVDLTSIVSNSIQKLSEFLRQVSTNVKHEAMTCLNALIRTHGKKISSKDYNFILTDVEPHIGENDLQLAALGLELLSSLLSVCPTNAPNVAKDIIPKTIEFVKCPMLHGNALKSLIIFFQSCVEFGGKEKILSFTSLLQQLEGCVTSSLTRPGYSSVAQCIAGITLKTSNKLKTNTVTKFMKQSMKTGPNQQIALLSIGEIGHKMNISEYGNIFNDLLTPFNSKEAYVREAASFALGNVAVGNMSVFLPQLLKMITTDTSHEYLLLSSLKENIISHQDQPHIFEPFLSEVMPLLIQRAEAKEEGVRKITAECLGRLGVIDSNNQVIPKLEKISRDESPKVRAVSVTALRFTLQGTKTAGIGHQIGSKIDAFLALLGDTDIDVRREAVLTARSFCLSKHVVINTTHLQLKILPALYKETKVHPELRHEVDYGNFKEIVDDGLALRKATFSCLEAVMDSSSHLIDMRQFNDAMKDGLADENHDVQIMTYQAYQKLARSHPGVLLEMLDGFPNLIMSTIKAHLKVAKTKEPQKAKECLRVIVSTMVTFNDIKGVELCTKYQTFFKQVCRTKLLKEILADLKQ